MEIIIELPFIKCLLHVRHWPEYFPNITSFNPQDNLVREVLLFRKQSLRHQTISWKSYSLEVEESGFQLRADSKVQCGNVLKPTESFSRCSLMILNSQAQRGRAGTHRGSMTFTLTHEWKSGWRSHHAGYKATPLSHPPQGLEWHRNRIWKNTVVS